MIAQKIVEAKQTQKPGRPAIASPNPRAATFGTSALEHFPPPLRRNEFDVTERDGINDHHRLVVLEPFCSGESMAL